MKKLAVIFMAVIVLPLLWISMISARYCWWQAAAFDMLMALILWVIWIVIKIGEEYKELRNRKDDFYA